MKHLLFTITTFVIVSYISCNSSGAGKATGNENAPASADASATSSSTGDAQFFCKIDGKDFSGKGSDKYANCAFITKPGVINFVLTPSVVKQQGIPPQFNFSVADKGVTTIHGNDNSDYSVRYSEPNTSKDYQCKEMTVTITYSGTSRVTGTFSGTLVESNTDKQVPVTDGKFDIPYSTLSTK